MPSPRRLVSYIVRTIGKQLLTIPICIHFVVEVILAGLGLIPQLIEDTVEFVNYIIIKFPRLFIENLDVLEEILSYLHAPLYDTISQSDLVLATLLYSKYEVIEIINSVKIMLHLYSIRILDVSEYVWLSILATIPDILTMNDLIVGKFYNIVEHSIDLVAIIISKLKIRLNVLLDIDEYIIIYLRSILNDVTEITDKAIGTFYLICNQNIDIITNLISKFTLRLYLNIDVLEELLYIITGNLVDSIGSSDLISGKFFYSKFEEISIYQATIFKYFLKIYNELSVVEYMIYNLISTITDSTILGDTALGRFYYVAVDSVSTYAHAIIKYSIKSFSILDIFDYITGTIKGSVMDYTAISDVTSGKFYSTVQDIVSFYSNIIGRYTIKLYNTFEASEYVIYKTIGQLTDSTITSDSLLGKFISIPIDVISLVTLIIPKLKYIFYAILTEYEYINYTIYGKLTDETTTTDSILGKFLHIPTDSISLLSNFIYKEAIKIYNILDISEYIIHKLAGVVTDSTTVEDMLLGKLVVKTEDVINLIVLLIPKLKYIFYANLNNIIEYIYYKIYGSLGDIVTTSDSLTAKLTVYGNEIVNLASSFIPAFRYFFYATLNIYEYIRYTTYGTIKDETTTSDGIYGKFASTINDFVFLVSNIIHKFTAIVTINMNVYDIIINKLSGLITDSTSTSDSIMGRYKIIQVDIIDMIVNVIMKVTIIVKSNLSIDERILHYLRGLAYDSNNITDSIGVRLNSIIREDISVIKSVLVWLQLRSIKNLDIYERIIHTLSNLITENNNISDSVIGNFKSMVTESVNFVKHVTWIMIARIVYILSVNDVIINKLKTNIYDATSITENVIIRDSMIIRDRVDLIKYVKAQLKGSYKHNLNVNDVVFSYLTQGSCIYGETVFGDKTFG